MTSGNDESQENTGRQSDQESDDNSPYCAVLGAVVSSYGSSYRSNRANGQVASSSSDNEYYAQTTQYDRNGVSDNRLENEL